MGVPEIKHLKSLRQTTQLRCLLQIGGLFSLHGDDQHFMKHREHGGGFLFTGFDTPGY